MYIFKRLIVTAVLVVCVLSSAFAEDKQSIYEYIEQYHPIAIEEMNRSGIPASITLAQGILESAYGNSYLAKQGKNHFGIKCHDWKGPSVRVDDDYENECFRKYNSVHESYIDHSNFLTRSNRYASLFQLDIKDYRGWATGLKKAGYATSPLYAKHLIEIIEQYDLAEYDKSFNGQIVDNRRNRIADYESGKQKGDSERSLEVTRRFKKSDIFYYNRIKTVIVRDNSTARQVSRAYDISEKRLCKYNEFEKGYVIPAGTKVFLQPKRNQAPINQKTHNVKNGESMMDIAQYYGVKLNKLLSRNFLSDGMEPAVGEVIYLRGSAPYAPSLENDRRMQIADAIDERPINNRPSSVNTYRKEHTTSNTNATYGTARTDNKVNTNASADNSKNYNSYNNDTRSNTGNYRASEHTELEYQGNQIVSNGKVVALIEEPGNDYYEAPELIEKPRTTTTIVRKDKESSVRTNANPAVNDNLSHRNIFTYTVQKGDTLFSLYRKYGIKVAEIKRINALTDDTILIGQELKLYTNN